MANSLTCLACISLIFVVAEGKVNHESLRNSLCFVVLGTCNEFGLGGSSGVQCLTGFPPLSYVLKSPVTEDMRQTVIPGINFTCNGNVTRWTIGAAWESGATTFAELQIWRNQSNTQYMKVNGSNIIVEAESGNQVYELDIPLVFQEGDVLGFFQPSKMNSQTNFYLEISEKATVYYNELRGGDTTAPALFDISSADGVDTNYPLISVTTGKAERYNPVRS